MGDDYASENWPEKVEPVDAMFRRIQKSIVFTNKYLEHWELLVGNNLNVLKYNIHEDENVPRSFFCKTLHDTKNTCNALVGYETPKNDIDFSFLYYRIAVEAYHKGLIKEEITPWRAAERLYIYFTRRRGISLRDIPVHCIEKDYLEEIFSRSLELEKQIAPDWHVAAGGEEMMREEFEEKSRKWCIIPMRQLFGHYGHVVEMAFN